MTRGFTVPFRTCGLGFEDRWSLSVRLYALNERPAAVNTVDEAGVQE